MAKIIKVTVRGQVSIPSPIRKKFNIEPDSRVPWHIEGNSIRIIPLSKDPASVFRGQGQGRYFTKRLIKDRANERKKEAVNICRPAPVRVGPGFFRVARPEFKAADF
jgi:AbrB family looped-hinge helix DNA binding protein